VALQPDAHPESVPHLRDGADREVRAARATVIPARGSGGLREGVNSAERVETCLWGYFLASCIGAFIRDGISQPDGTGAFSTHPGSLA